jgi:FMN phosphatase YigB (HAD superfamily)/DNA-binding XRE family transcriptional regulator
MVMNPGVAEVDEKSLGLRLQAARKAAGFTQQELCEKANLAYSTLAKIERGAIKSPSVFTIQSIAGVLNTSLDELMGLSRPVQGQPVKVAKKTSRSGIKFVYFDINGCLVRFFHQAFTKLAQETGVPAEQIETAFWHYNDAVCRGDMDLVAFNQALAQRLNLGSVDWKRYYMEAIEPIAEMQALLPWVAEHYEVGLLSNIMPGFIQEMLAKKLLPNVDYRSIIDSSEVKAIKPEPGIYQIAQQKAGVEPREILLMDDSRTNLMAAEHLGWHVLWFDDYRPAESARRIREALAFGEATEVSAPETPAAPEPVQALSSPESAESPALAPTPGQVIETPTLDLPAPNNGDYVIPRGEASYESRG